VSNNEDIAHTTFTQFTRYTKFATRMHFTNSATVLWVVSAWWLSCVSCVAGPAAQSDPLADAWRRIDEHVTARMRDQNTPGLALAITSRDRLLHVGTYGLANVDAKRPVTPDTLFEIGSISKSFTAIALLQLRDQGAFDPQAPITKYLPWFSIKSAFRPITGHDLLSHTSGLPRDRDDVPSSPYQAYGVREREAGYEPGVHYAYSNVGFQVLGYALESIAKHPYPEVIAERILRPLGMTATEAQFTHETRPRLAVGYERMYDDRPGHPSHPLVPATWLEYAAGDGSIVSTAADMAAYARMLLNKGAGPNGRRVLSEEGFALLTQRAIGTGENSWYGYGMGSVERDGSRYLSHSGGMVGYSSMLVVAPDLGLAAVVMVNGPGDAASVARDAVLVASSALRGESLPPVPSLEDRTRVANPREFAGEYRADSGGPLVVQAHGERLLIGVDGSAVAAAERRGTDTFFVNSPAMDRFLLRFQRSGGKVTSATHGNHTYVAGPAHERQPRTPSGWEAYPGHYRTTHAWFNNFRIVVRGDRLFLVSPDGSETTMEALAPGLFKEEGPSSERLRFDSLVGGQALRANLSGVDYYRVFTP